MQRVPKSTGCALSGFVLVKKVPGTLHFLPKSSGHSFDYHTINMSHQVGYMYYGNKPSPRRRQVVQVIVLVKFSGGAQLFTRHVSKLCRLQTLDAIMAHVLPVMSV